MSKVVRLRREPKVSEPCTECVPAGDSAFALDQTQPAQFPILDKDHLRGDWPKTRDALNLSHLHLSQSSRHIYERACYHAYFGNIRQPNGAYKLINRRGGSRTPTVLSADFIMKLRDANLEKRRLLYPTVVRIAELMEELRNLEQNLDY